MSIDAKEAQRRWRLVLGSAAENADCPLSGADVSMDKALGQLYNLDDSRQGGLGSSAPKVARWLGDIREYFPRDVVQLIQKDALERLNLQALLLEPEVLESIEADVHLAATLISLNRVMPDKIKDTARQVISKIVAELLAKLSLPMQQAIRGSLNRATRNHRPRHNEIDWMRTIRANLRHYQPEYRSIIPERLIGFGRKQQRLQDIILCVDQSGSMASSVVYASIFAAVMASMPAVSTQMIVFDTEIVDLTHLLEDPVEVLFGTQLGGGTDINRALGYCQQRVSQAEQTVLVLITDLYEGGDAKSLLRRAAELKRSGVQLITLLALNDDGAPSYDQNLAARFAALDIPCFACTPNQFPSLMAAALQKQDLHAWAAQENVALARAEVKVSG